MSAEHIHFFFAMRDQIKLYHWQTRSYSRHKATDEVLERLDTNIDKFVEVYMGKYGRPIMKGKMTTTIVQNLNESQIVSFVKRCIEELINETVQDLDKSRDTDLINIRDEMLADLNQLLYLFTLK
jgi:DNA-binding ferritin-like protein